MTPTKPRESADTLDAGLTATTTATATTMAFLDPMAQGTAMRQSSRPLAATDSRNILIQTSTLPANVPRLPQLPQVLVPQQHWLNKPNDMPQWPRLPSCRSLHQFQDLSPSATSRTLTSMALAHHTLEELQMHFLRRQQLPSLRCSLMSSRVYLWSTLMGTHLSIPLSMRVPSRTPNSLHSHIGETRTSLRTHTLPLLMGELRRLVAHVARGVRTTTMRSPTAVKDATMTAALPLAGREKITTATTARTIPVIAARTRSPVMGEILVPMGADRQL